MKIWLITLLSVMLISAPTLAGIPLDHEGKPGIWFDLDSSNLMLQDLTEFKILKDSKVPALNLKIDLKSNTIASLKAEIKVTEKISKKWEEALEKSEELRILEFNRYQKDLSKQNKWYKSTPFVMTIGVFIGGLLAVGLSFGLNQGD